MSHVNKVLGCCPIWLGILLNKRSVLYPKGRYMQRLLMLSVERCVVTRDDFGVILKTLVVRAQICFHTVSCCTNIQKSNKRLFWHFFLIYIIYSIYIHTVQCQMRIGLLLRLVPFKVSPHIISERISVSISRLAGIYFITTIKNRPHKILLLRGKNDSLCDSDLNDKTSVCGMWRPISDGWMCGSPW